MAKLHSYYITNAKSELKFAFNDLSEDKFEATIQEALSKVYSTQDIVEEPISDEDDDYEDEEDFEEFDNNKLEITNWVNITDGELKDLMRVDVSVVIEAPPLPVDHGVSEFNMEQILDNVLSNN
jgi:hypothetical protein